MAHTGLKCVLSLLVAACGLAAGCSQFIDPNVPEPIRPFVEPQYGREYLLYRPSGYDRTLAWPLIVVCHGSGPDSPNKQIRAWTELAESHGLLVIAPALTSTGRYGPRKAAQRILLQREDENHILAAIQHVRAGHSVASDRIFVYGWSTGTYAALHTGLRHPELFRAISLARPRFDDDCLADVQDAVDHYQPVYVNYSVSDAITGKQGRHCEDWLRSRGADVLADSVGPVRKTDCDRIVEFFQETVRKKPLIRIRAYPTGRKDPLETQFKLRCSFAPTRYSWEFGDGRQSAAAEPIHAYARPGTYRAAVTVDDPNGREHRRVLDLNLP